MKNLLVREHIALATLLAAVGCSPICSSIAIAAPEDLRVLTDEISEKGEFSAEAQGVTVRRRDLIGTRRSSVIQGLTEISYGLSDWLEVSLQFPVSRDAVVWRSNGVNVELQFVAPHESASGFYWGGRAEVGSRRSVNEGEPVIAVEARPIFGYRIGNWHAVLNTGVRIPVSGNDRRATFEPSTKLVYQLSAKTAVGAEFYVDAGPLAHPLPRALRQELALLVVDVNSGHFHLNLGLGRGTTAASDGTVFKFVVSRPFD